MACQLVHTAILNASKGGGTLYGANDFFLAAADAGSQPQTTTEDEKTIMAPDPTQESDHQQVFLHIIDNWLEPIPSSEP